MGWAEAMHRKVENELRPLREAIEGSTGKWNLFRSQAELATTTFGPLEKYETASFSVSPRKGGVNRGPSRVATRPAAPASMVPAAKQPARPSSTDSGQRVGSFMQTATGRKYWPCDPKPDEVFIEDIAHSLSLQCRYAGHVLRFYSVAEHSVLIARHLAAKHAPEVALAGLLHDAPEAYCVDVPRPLKPYLANYKDIEARNWAAIATRFRLPEALPTEVHEADERIIADELANLVPMDWHERYAGRRLGVRLRYWTPEEAKVEFLATFDALMGRQGRVA